MRRAVEQFGRGELATRLGSSRRDEIGELSRAFDVMADQIETLLSAERRLLQDVSHELRSPLARLNFAVELARTSDDRDAALDRIKRDVDRLSALVDELLQLTRAEGDPSARALEEVRLDVLLRALAEDCTLEAEAKKCRLILRAEGPWAVQGERELLRRAVENVLRNALRYAPDGTPIEIGLRLRDGDALISVRDHGVGVPDGDLEAIFETFYRVEDDRSRTSGGVGLGLSIARRAVVLHGGNIAARNAHPGLRVSIALPHARDGSE
jgi:two-component system sensor histidine kinase CpxA